MKVLITGGTGLLGTYLTGTRPAGIELTPTYYPLSARGSDGLGAEARFLDVTDAPMAAEIIGEVRPDWVVHTASIASVDHVEANREEAENTNLRGTANIVEACRRAGAALLYTSSNAVFDGEAPPYAEEAPVNPLNYYGKLKVLEERMVSSSGLRYAIVRPILMYGWNTNAARKNPVTWLIEKLSAGEEVSMVDDIYCDPLYAADCAEVIWNILLKGKEGVFHAGGEEEMNRYEFALAAAEVFGLDKGLIKPVRSSYFKGLSPRPVNTTYSISKIKRELGVFPSAVREGLERMREER